MNADDRDLRRRKVTDAAIFLPLLGTFLLMPPLIRVFASNGEVAGIPVVIVYLFAIWLVLIIVAWRLAGPLRGYMQAERPRTDDPDDPPHQDSPLSNKPPGIGQ